MTRPDVGPAQAFAFLARALTDQVGTQPTLEQIAHHAVRVVPSRWAVALVAERITDTPARLCASTDPDVTDPVAVIAGAAGSSPGRSAFEAGTVCLLPDLTVETRFPDYCHQMVERTPIRSVLSVPVPGRGHVLGVLTSYSDQANAFAAKELERALVLATHAGVALDAALAEDRARNLEKALSSSRSIGAAIGVLVERHRLTEDVAFGVLRLASQHTNRKLADVAQRLVATGELPDETAIVQSVLANEAEPARPA